MAMKRFLTILKYRPRENDRERRARLPNIIVGGLMILDLLTLLGTLIYYPMSAGSITHDVDVMYLALFLTLIVCTVVLAINHWVSVELESTVFLTAPTVRHGRWRK